MLMDAIDQMAATLAEARINSTIIDPELDPTLSESEAQNLQLAALLQFDPEIAGYTTVGMRGRHWLRPADPPSAARAADAAFDSQMLIKGEP